MEDFHSMKSPYGTKAKPKIGIGYDSIMPLLVNLSPSMEKESLVNITGKGNIPAHDFLMHTIMMFSAFIIPQRHSQRVRNLKDMQMQWKIFLAIKKMIV